MSSSSSSSIAVAMVNPTSGSHSATVPLSQSRPTFLASSSSPSSSSSHHIQLPRSAVKHKISLETMPASNSARKQVLVRDWENPTASPQLLRVNDEFTVSGKTFRVVEMPPPSSTPSTPQPAVQQSKLHQRKPTPFVSHVNQVSFQQQQQQQGNATFRAAKQRNQPTPFVPLSQRVQFFDSPNASSAYASSTSSSGIKFKLAAANEDEEDHRAVVVAPLPQSVLRFMAKAKSANSSGLAPRETTRGRAVKTTVRPAVPISRVVEMRLAPTPLRREIQQEGQRLQQLREELLARLEDYGLDVDRYARWTVYQLEQRVLALAEEQQRASVEAVLVEAGFDPRDFTDYSVEEIEAWLEHEISSMVEEEEEREPAVRFQGQLTEFPQSPSVIMDVPSFVTNRTYQEEPAFVHSYTDDNDDVDGSPSFIQEQQQQAGPVFDEEESMLSPIARRRSGAGAVGTPYSVKKLVTTPFFKRVATEEMTCERIRGELKQRGLKVGGLKSVIAERLAVAMEDEARGQGMEVMETEGHGLLGRVIERTFQDTGASRAVVEAWAPPPVGETDERLARFRVVHENGDVELLSLDEVELALV